MCRTALFPLRMRPQRTVALYTRNHGNAVHSIPWAMHRMANRWPKSRKFASLLIHTEKF